MLLERDDKAPEMYKNLGLVLLPGKEEVARAVMV
jgi:hypothetical protein